MFENLISNAKNLTRNPLGIIALFISLIYGFACLVLSTSISNLLNSQERLPLIWFIIAFPLIILSAFIFLVIKHHEKLYAPADFREDDTFIKTIGEKKLKQKAMTEVKSLENADVIPSKYKIKDTQNNIELIEKNVNANEEFVFFGGDDVNEHTYNEEAQMPTKPSLSELELLSRVTNSEKWAIQALSLKYNILFQSNVILHTQHRKFELDGFGTLGNSVYVIETKFWQSRKSINHLKFSLQEFIQKTKDLEKTYLVRNQEFIIIIALVFDDLNTIDKKELFKFIKNLYENTRLEFFDYRELRDNYDDEEIE